jgi:hypothetical protein
MTQKNVKNRREYRPETDAERAARHRGIDNAIGAVIFMAIGGVIAFMAAHWH